jgi:hypothetical protein
MSDSDLDRQAERRANLAGLRWGDLDEKGRDCYRRLVIADSARDLALRRPSRPDGPTMMASLKL